MVLKNNTLSSPHNFVPIFESYDNLANLLIDKSKEVGSKDESSFYMIDAESGQKKFFKNLESQSRGVASRLKKEGLKKGDVVLYSTKNALHLHTFFVGVWRADGVVRSSYPEDDEDVQEEKILESNCKWVYCDPELCDKFRKAAQKLDYKLNIIVSDSESIDECVSVIDYFEDDGTACPVAPECKGEDPAILISTSGTTGKSKAAVHSHRAILNFLSLNCFLPSSPSGFNFLVSKPTHYTGSNIPLGAIATAQKMLTLKNASEKNILDAIETYKPAVVHAFPGFMTYLVKKEAESTNLDSIESIKSGGGHVTQALRHSLKKRLPNLKEITVGYGTTETSYIISTYDFNPTKSMVNNSNETPVLSPDIEHQSHFQSDSYKAEFDSELLEKTIGKVCPGVTLQVRNTETQEILGPNQNGEFWVQSKGMFSNYFKNDQETKRAFENGWFKTGDVGYYDENEFLYIVDRLKDIFKYFNNHISPTEVEAVILKHPLVSEVVVVGIENMEEGGAVPRAWVVLKGIPPNQNYLDISDILEDIKKFSNDKLPSYKQLRGGVYALSALPRGKTGKVQRRLALPLVPLENGIYNIDGQLH